MMEFKIGDEIRIIDTGFSMKGFTELGDKKIIKGFFKPYSYPWGVIFTDGSKGGAHSSMSNFMGLISTSKSELNYEIY